MGFPESAATPRGRDVPPHPRSPDERAAAAADPAVTRNERASDRDQVANISDRASRWRDTVAAQRDHDGEYRDAAAERRDVDAESRDVQADLCDQTAHDMEVFSLSGESLSGCAALARESRQAAASQRVLARLDRQSAAADRDQADLDRCDSAADRTASSGERQRAGSDRAESLSDRVAATASQLAASIDSLTGVYLRGPGLLELERDIARSTRTGMPFTLAFLDIDHLKEVNDAGGHGAGDRLLLRVSDTLKTKLRPYDLILRFGGDEFVCGLAGLTIVEAFDRMTLVQDALSETPEPGSLTIGMAELRPEESLWDLIERADSDLYRLRQRRKHAPKPARRSVRLP